MSDERRCRYCRRLEPCASIECLAPAWEDLKRTLAEVFRLRVAIFWLKLELLEFKLMNRILKIQRWWYQRLVLRREARR